LLAAGGAIERFALAVHAQGFAWRCIAAVGDAALGEAVGADARWATMGAIAVGRTTTGAASARPPSEPSVRFE
jgi:nitroreductase